MSCNHVYERNVYLVLALKDNKPPLDLWRFSKSRQLLYLRSISCISRSAYLVFVYHKDSKLLSIYRSIIVKAIS